MPYKYLFFDDYSEGAHPRILEALARTNLQQEPGYVMDSFAVEATGFIREKFRSPEADIHFVSSGTQANLCVLSALLKPYESVIAAESGHINQHESGAIEATGHKINAVTGQQGKSRRLRSTTWSKCITSIRWSCPGRCTSHIRQSWGRFTT